MFKNGVVGYSASVDSMLQISYSFPNLRIRSQTRNGRRGEPAGGSRGGVLHGVLLRAVVPALRAEQRAAVRFLAFKIIINRLVSRQICCPLHRGADAATACIGLRDAVDLFGRRVISSDSIYRILVRGRVYRERLCTWLCI